MIRKREIAKRVFAQEFNDSEHKIEQEGEKTPLYVLTPTGAKCNRVFVVGVLLDKEEIKPDSNFWRMRVSDPTGTFICTAGRFQPEALEALLEIEPPEMVAVVGKVHVFEGDTRTYVSLRPETVTIVENEVRDYWVYETSKRTLERIEKMESGDGNGNITLAKDIYNSNLEEYKEMVKRSLMAIKEEFEAFKSEPEETTEEEFGEEPELDEMEFEEEEWDLSDILGE